MPTDWNAVRHDLSEILGEAFSYRPGHWFCVPHDLVFRRSGSRFSDKEKGDGRPVVLATSYGPNATLFARSTRPSACPHTAHRHKGGAATCRLDKDGWIVLEVPVNVDVEHLGQHTYSCEEPDRDALLAAFKRALRP